MLRKILLAIFTGILLLKGSLARAQGDFTAAITAPDLSAFPVISLGLDVYGPGGLFIENLTAGQVQILEDDQPLAVSDLQTVEPGIDVFVAVNAGSALGLRDGAGVSRYDEIVEVIGYWAGAGPGDPADSYSLLVNQGASSVDLDTPQDLLAAFMAYQPDFRDTEPSSVSLAAAVDMAGSVPDNQARKRAIVYITPNLDGAALAALPNLREQAAQSGARVFVWLVGSLETVDTPGAQELDLLARSTGGRILIFSGEETLPDLEDYLHPLRTAYTLSYETSLRGGGEHTLALRVSLPEGDFTTPTRSFQLDIQPPNPMFVSPPSEIVRTSPEGSQDPLASLSPLSTGIQVLVEYPDGIERAITRSALYADGVLVDENTAEPFDQLEWDLNDLTVSGQHTLRVEVEDSLGLTGSSMETRVDVNIDLPKVSLWETLARSPVLPAAAAVILATGSLGVVFFLANRRRYRGREGSPATGRRSKDPLTQPVQIQNNSPATFRSAWPKRPPSAPTNQASLIRLGENAETLTASPVLLHGPEVTLGQDPTQATCVLNDASVDGLHARLRCEPDGSWMLYDQGSIAGTWVNYAPVSSEGARLEHGDLVNFGRVAFRFNETQPQRIRKPSIQVYDERI